MEEDPKLPRMPKEDDARRFRGRQRKMTPAVSEDAKRNKGRHNILSTTEYIIGSQKKGFLVRALYSGEELPNLSTRAPPERDIFTDHFTIPKEKGEKAESEK